MQEEQPSPTINHLQNLTTNSDTKEELIKQARLDILKNLQTALTTDNPQEAEQIFTTVITALTHQTQEPEKFGGQPLFDNDEIEADLEPLLKSIAEKHEIQSPKDRQVEDIFDIWKNQP